MQREKLANLFWFQEILEHSFFTLFHPPTPSKGGDSSLREELLAVVSPFGGGWGVEHARRKSLILFQMQKLSKSLKIKENVATYIEFIHKVRDSDKQSQEQFGAFLQIRIIFIYYYSEN